MTNTVDIKVRKRVRAHMGFHDRISFRLDDVLAALLNDDLETARQSVLDCCVEIYDECQKKGLKPPPTQFEQPSIMLQLTGRLADLASSHLEGLRRAVTRWTYDQGKVLVVATKNPDDIRIFLFGVEQEATPVKVIACPAVDPDARTCPFVKDEVAKS